MPVKSSLDYTLSPKMNLIDYLSTDSDSYPLNDPLLPDDIWKKFELDFPELSGFEDIFIDPAMADECINIIKSSCEIRNHDCMWAGHCASKEHPADEPRPHFVPLPPQPIKEEPKTAQQSLLKPALRAVLPQTPPMSDDEEIKTKMQLIKEEINDDEEEEDSDLCEYFRKEEEIEVKEEKIEVTAVRSYAESDHSYHKGKIGAMQMMGYGIDTPSDSEEEIDVVNVNDKFHFTATPKPSHSHSHPHPSSFPTNPSNRDRHQIQRRLSTAITKKKSAAQYTAQKTTNKPHVQLRTHTHMRNKRRHCANSSDSEPEPSEKRSLHNNMERQRRIDLRNAFEDLRVLVPEVSKKERAAKVVILREAALYCNNLTSTQINHNKYLEELKRKQAFLRRKVSNLRMKLAAQR